MTMRVRHSWIWRVKAATALLLTVLLFATTASLARAAEISDEMKPRRTIPLVSGIWDMTSKKKKKKVDETETLVVSSPADVADDDPLVTVAEEEVAAEEVVSINAEPVCRSDATGTTHCRDRGGDEAPSSEEEDAEEAPKNDEPVCRSDATGTMKCRDRGGDEAPAGGDDDRAFRCKDLQGECAAWVRDTAGDDAGTRVVANACATRSAFMAHYCAVSCDACDVARLGYRLSTMLEGGLGIIPFCQDNNFECRAFANAGECRNNSEYMSMFCPASCGICSEESNGFGVGQRLLHDDPHTMTLIQEELVESVEYMRTVRRGRPHDQVREHCLNMVPDCTLWAALGECEKNKEYMHTMCAPACNFCHSGGHVM